MAFEGIVINAVVTAFAAACYLYAGVAVHRRNSRHSRRIGASAAFFLVAGAYLALAALRQAAAYAGTLDPAYARLDYLVYHVVAVPAAFAIVPLAYLTAYAVWGRARLAVGVAAFFAFAASVGLGFVYAEGITGPEMGYWGSDWSINSTTAKIMIVLFTTLPAVFASIVLVYSGSKMEGPAGKRLRLVGTSFLIYYVAFTVDAYGLEGLPFIGVRLVTAGAAILGYVAYARVPDAPAFKPIAGGGPSADRDA